MQVTLLIYLLIKENYLCSFRFSVYIIMPSTNNDGFLFFSPRLKHSVSFCLFIRVAGTLAWCLTEVVTRKIFVPSADSERWLRCSAIRNDICCILHFVYIPSQVNRFPFYLCFHMFSFNIRDNRILSGAFSAFLKVIMGPLYLLMTLGPFST